MLPASMLLATGLYMLSYGRPNVSSMRHIYGNHLTTLDSTFFLKLMPQNQGHSGRLTEYVQTPWSQDVFTNQILDP